MRRVEIARLELAFFARPARDISGYKLGVNAARAAAKVCGDGFVLKLTLWAGLARLFAARRSSSFRTRLAGVFRGLVLVLELSFGARRAGC